MKYFKAFANHSEYESYITGSSVAYPNVSVCEDEYEVHITDIGEIVDPDKYKKQYLTFEITSDGVITWKAQNTAYTTTIQYSKNGGEWTSITSNTGDSAPTISVVSGDKVQFRGDNATYSSGSLRYNYFNGTTCGFNACGNIMSLINSTGFESATTLNSTYTFYCLFVGCSGLVSAEHLVLPATSTTLSCYYNMFSGCTSLTSAPELPATMLEQGCYQRMFERCTSLTTAPELPATTLARNCYQMMFNGCTSLTSGPSILPATTLADRCYQSMFAGCTGLTSAPELPATTLETNCYTGMFTGCKSLVTAPSSIGNSATTMAASACTNMFKGCTGLTSAPELPATALTIYCYFAMFSGCTSLNYIKCLATDISASNCTTNWVSGVQTTSGRFVKAPSMTSWTTGDNGIPSNWTVEDAS